MAGLADFEVPSYLQPPSPAQAEQLAMKRNQQEMAQAQMLQRGYEKMQKKVAMAKVLGRAQELQAAGLEPEDARAQAFLAEGKPLVENPDDWLRVTEHLQESLARKQAVKNFHNDIQEELRNNPDADPSEAAARAWARNGVDIAGKNYTAFLNAQSRAESARARIKSNEKIAADKLDLGEKRLDFGYYRAGKQADTAEEARASREKVAEEQIDSREKIAAKRDTAASWKAAGADEELQKVSKSLAKANDDLESKLKHPWLSPLQNETQLRALIKQLEARRSKLLKKYGLTDKDTAPADAATTDEGDAADSAPAAKSGTVGRFKYTTQ